MLWHIEILPADGQSDHEGERLATEAFELGLAGPWMIRASRGFLVEGAIAEESIRRASREVLSDPVVESVVIRAVGLPVEGPSAVVSVLPKPGVTDPEAESAYRS